MLTQVSVTTSQQLRQKPHEQCIGYNILIKLLKLTPESESQNIDFCVLLQMTTMQNITLKIKLKTTAEVFSQVSVKESA